jgi:hypothetical protein
VACHACCIWFDRRAEVLACDPRHAKTGSQIEQAIGESDLWRSQGGRLTLVMR